MSGRNRMPRGHRDGPMPVVHRGPGPLPPHPAALEEELELQHRDIQRIVAENGHVVEENVILQRELSAVKDEIHRLAQIIPKLHADRDARARDLIDRGMKLEAELRETEPLRADVGQLRAEAQKLNSLRQELSNQVQNLTKDTSRLKAENEQGVAIKADIDGMHKDLAEMRRDYEMMKKANEEHLIQKEAMEKNLISMAREIEKLRGEQMRALFFPTSFSYHPDQQAGPLFALTVARRTPSSIEYTQTMSKRSSGLDFSDRLPALDAHPDMDKYNPQKSTLQRNKTERGRLQGLQRSTSSATKKPSGPKNFGERVSLWLINEGQRHLFFATFLFLHLIVSVFGIFHYGLKDNLVGARQTFGVTFTIARAAALVLHVDVIFILLPVCRNFVSVMRRTPLGTVIPFDKNITLHKATAWAIFTGSLVHTLAHIVNLYRLTMADGSANTTGKRVVFFITANFIIGPLITGWLMWGCLGVMVYYAIEKRRRQKNGGFEKFWYTHHLFIPFFILWQLHGMFCMIKPDRPPFCSFNTIGVFWRYWIVGGIIWIYERILREVRSRHVTYISKVVQHPSNVMEVQIKKEKTTTRAGQYIFINCPEISYFQWHPFTLTSAPEEDYISVHIRVEGDFTTAFAKALGCDFGSKGEKGKGDAGGKVIGTNTNPPVNRTLPRVMVDGPFGTSSEEFLDYETVLLVGAGIGVTPFASILKNIWYRMNNFNHSKPTRLSKVYFTWVIRDFGTAEWFHSLLHAIEEQDTQNRIEINIYLTAKIKEDDMNNIIVQDVGAEKDAITSLRAPTHFGRPNWDKIFSSIGEKHPESDVGVFFCGPAAIASTLHIMSNKHSDVKGTRFFFGKENF